MPKVTLFYAQSDPLECRRVNLCPKWLSLVFSQTCRVRSTYMWFMPKVTLFYAPSDPVSTLNDLCPKWLKKCALSDPPAATQLFIPLWKLLNHRSASGSQMEGACWKTRFGFPRGEVPNRLSQLEVFKEQESFRTLERHQGLRFFMINFFWVIRRQKDTPWKMNGWNLQPSPIWKGKWSSKPPSLWSMLIFQGVLIRMKN